jgi:putative oxygen-independent coproporphyrinogen III oxidase
MNPPPESLPDAARGTAPGKAAAEEGLSFPDGPPPLALYVHVPWCVSKCPYCDFNSHALRDTLPEAAYIDALLADLEREVGDLEAQRPLISVFIGGGTPSLLSGSAIRRLIQGIRDRIDLVPEAEITLEANPGTSEARRFAQYREAGVNRLSIGAQSLSDTRLARIGRIHGASEVRTAVAQARSAGFTNLNLDLMYALPGQDLGDARADLTQALTLAPEHLSYYQLTLEPNTPFFAAPPPLPGHDLAADIHQQGLELLAGTGYVQYEVSAYAQRQTLRCRHNLNYWEFGDYLGIGAGAHGKVTRPLADKVVRWWKPRHPNAYLTAAGRGRKIRGGGCGLAPEDLVLEFAMNALRLTEGFGTELFTQRTGLPRARMAPGLQRAVAHGLLHRQGDRMRPTERGRRFLDDLVRYFLPA